MGHCHMGDHAYISPDNVDDLHLLTRTLEIELESHCVRNEVRAGLLI